MFVIGSYHSTSPFEHIQNMDTRATCNSLFILICCVAIGFSLQIQNKTSIEWDVVRIYCDRAVAANVTDVAVYWTQESDNSFKSDGRELNFTRASRRDAGTYECHEYNNRSMTNTTVQVVHLTINYPVEIKDVSTNSTQLMVGESFNLVFNITGCPSPSYSVELDRNHAHMGGETSVTGTVHFSTRPLNCSDSGLYKVTAYNSVISTNDSIAVVYDDNVTVLCPPTPSEDTVYTQKPRLGQSATFVMTTYGYPYPNFTWFPANDKPRVTSRGRQSRPYLTSSKWNISNVSLSDYGVYVVEMQNQYAITNDSFTLQPDGPPEEVTDVTVGEVTDDSATLTWIAGYDYGARQTFVVLRPNQAGEYVPLSEFADSPSSQRLQRVERVLDSLGAEEDYNVTIQAKNARGSSAMSASVTFKTEAESSRSPAAVIVGSIIGGIVGVAVLVFVFYKVVIPLYRKGQSEKGGLTIEELPGKGVNQTAKWRASVTMPYRPSVC